jgi:DNA polymerase alpha-associated DNA helicase A
MAEYPNQILESLKRTIKQISSEEPTIVFRVKLKLQEIAGSLYKTTFSIIQTSQQIKNLKLIEERVDLYSDSEKSSAKIIDVYGENIVLLCKKELHGKEYNLRRNSNFNNEILLAKLEDFLCSGKRIHGFLRSIPTEYKNNNNDEQKPKNLFAPLKSDSQSNEKDSLILNDPLNCSFAQENAERSNANSLIEQKLNELSLRNTAYFDISLNESQKEAVNESFKNSPYKILGPPGTGKTRTLLEIIFQHLNLNRSVIVCGPSNLSIDNIIERFIESEYYGQKKTKFYRLGSSQKGLFKYNLENIGNKYVDFIPDPILERPYKSQEMIKNKESANKKTNKNKQAFKKKELKESFHQNNKINKEKKDNCSLKEKNKIKYEFLSNFKKESKLVFATLFSSLKENFFFDLCIIDESCQATEAEAFMGAVKAKNFILAGDPYQLGSINSQQSLYEKLNIKTIVLNEQYRMEAALMEFSNKYFYNEQIISKKSDDFLFFGESKFLFVDTSYFEYSEENSELSKTNYREASLIKDIVEYIGLQLIKETCAINHDILQFKSLIKQKIAIVSPYSAQALLIREFTDCEVDTVDSFQGQERDFIIISMVRSNEMFEIGFLKEERRMNVALTRCKRGLIVVGDSRNFKNNPFFTKLFDFLYEKAFVTDPETFRQLIK